VENIRVAVHLNNHYDDTVECLMASCREAVKQGTEENIYEAMNEQVRHKEENERQTWKKWDLRILDPEEHFGQSPAFFLNLKKISTVWFILGINIWGTILKSF
jgi:hypothetical protein